MEYELIDLLQDAQTELKKIEHREATLAQQRAKVEEQINSLQRVLEMYRQKAGIAPSDDTIDSELAAEFRGLPPKSMAILWAKRHENRIVVNDAVKFLLRAGYFRTAREGAGALYPAIRRTPEFHQEGRGIYSYHDPSIVSSTSPEPVTVPTVVSIGRIVADNTRRIVEQQNQAFRDVATAAEQRSVAGLVQNTVQTKRLLDEAAARRAAEMQSLIGTN